MLILYYIYIFFHCVLQYVPQNIKFFNILVVVELLIKNI